MRRLAREFNRTTAKLAALLRSQEQFVADASHELRTPLTALRLRLENGESGSRVWSRSERLAGLVDELLELARADASGGLAGELPLGDVVERRVELWSALAEERGRDARGVADGARSCARARVASNRCSTICSRTLSTRRRPARRSSSPCGGAASCTSIDEGAGLTSEQRDRAFDRFWRASKAPGSGLGLSIARRLVELDGGTIELRGASTGGVDAVVRYPTHRS